MSIDIILTDRAKELSYSTGTGNFKLEGAAAGAYAAFGDTYSYNDTIFYAITDSTDFEVGSGQYVLDGSDNAVTRFPFNSSNSNNRVNFGVGVKEVFITYPGKYAVVSALPNNTEPAKSGVPFWNNAHTLHYNANIIWDDTNSRLALRRADPSYTLDIGGTNTQSTIRVSGMIVGDSGIMFSGVSSDANGRQIEPFLRSIADPITGLNAVISLSGNVDERIQLEKQPPMLVFAGPSGDCGCSEDYPTFRALRVDDVPSLSFLYTSQYNTGDTGSVALYKSSGVYQYDSYLKWNTSSNRLGVNKLSPAYTLDVDGTVGISGNIVASGEMKLAGDLFLIDSLYNSRLRTTSTIKMNQSGIFVENQANRINIGWRQQPFYAVRGFNIEASSGLDPGILNVYSTYSPSGAPDPTVHFQRLQITGERFGNFKISNGASGSGTLRDLEFDVSTIHNKETFFDTTVTNSGNVNTSGNFVLNGTMTTYSGIAPNTIIDTSGLLRIPTYASVAAATGALPVANVGAIALGGTSILISNGTNWLSGVMGIV